MRKLPSLWPASAFCRPTAAAVFSGKDRKLESYPFKSPGKQLNHSAGNGGDPLSPPLTLSVNMTLSKALQTQLLWDALQCWTNLKYWPKGQNCNCRDKSIELVEGLQVTLEQTPCALVTETISRHWFISDEASGWTRTDSDELNKQSKEKQCLLFFIFIFIYIFFCDTPVICTQNVSLDYFWYKDKIHLSFFGKYIFVFFCFLHNLFYIYFICDIDIIAENEISGKHKFVPSLI